MVPVVVVAAEVVLALELMVLTQPIQVQQLQRTQQIVVPAVAVVAVQMPAEEPVGTVEMALTGLCKYLGMKSEGTS
jgi:hypothetical protein